MSGPRTNGPSWARVLVIEDEFLIAQEIESALREGGFKEIAQASTERAAFLQIEREVWDLVILDANLNGRPVGEIARALRERGARILVVTGYGRESLPPEVVDQPLLEKPFDPAKLLQAVRDLCEQ